MTTSAKMTAAIVGDRVGLLMYGERVGPTIDANQADALGDNLSNCAMRLRYEGWTPREGVAGPLFDRFGRNPHSWNIDLDEDDDQPEPLDPAAAIGDLVGGIGPAAHRVLAETADDGSGRPGAGMVGGAIAVWTGLQRGRASIATIATVFNLSPAMIREAVNAQPFLVLAEGEDDASTYVEHDGE